MFTLRTLIAGCFVLGLGFGLALAPAAHAYPSTIGHGYPSCATCHYNPLGNGPLRDYGRALGAGTLADRILTPQASDEEMGEGSGFLGAHDRLPLWLRPAFDFRGMLLTSGLNTSASTRFIPMQIEASVVANVGPAVGVAEEAGEVFVTGTFGYVPVPAGTPAAQAATISTWISREHYAANRWNDGALKGWSVMAGMMDPAFGLRVPDHVAYIRSQALVNHNDQIHALFVQYAKPTLEVGVQASAGNLFQAADIRISGIGLHGEVGLSDTVRTGASVRYGRNSYRTVWLGALHARAGLGSEHSLLAELALNSTVPVTGAASSALMAFVQPGIVLRRGLQFLPTVEYFFADLLNAGAQSLRMGPGLSWMPVPRVEVRTDLQWSRQWQNSLATDSANWLTQLHLYF